MDVVALGELVLDFLNNSTHHSEVHVGIELKPRLIFIEYVYSICVHYMCTVYVYSICVQYMCTAYVYSICVQYMCTAYVYSICVQYMCTVYVYSVCVQYMCTVYSQACIAQLYPFTNPLQFQPLLLTISKPQVSCKDANAIALLYVVLVI